MATVIAKSTKTTTLIKNGVKTTIVETTITNSDGTKEVIREETTEGGATKTSRKGSTEPTPSSSKKHTPSISSTPKQTKKPVDLQDFRQQALARHNVLREKHGSGPLKLSQDLNDYAQKYAETIARTGELKHSDCLLDGKLIGENIAYKSSTGFADFTGDEPTDMWYSEIKMYNFDRDVQKGTGHFTQLIWKASKELGMGKARGSQGTVYAVGTYRPEGNIITTFKDNVLPAKK